MIDTRRGVSVLREATTPARLRSAGGVTDYCAQEAQPMNIDTIEPIEKQSIAQITLGYDEDRVADEAIAALASHSNLYVFRMRLARVITDSVPVPGRYGRMGTPYIEEAPRPMLRSYLSTVARFYTTKKSGVRAEVSVPDSCVRDVATRGRWPGIRPLVMIVTRPVKLHDGRVIDAIGYDEATGIIYTPSGQEETPDEDWQVPAESRNRLCAILPAMGITQLSRSTGICVRSLDDAMSGRWVNAPTRAKVKRYFTSMEGGTW